MVGERAVLLGRDPRREDDVRDALELGAVGVEHDQGVELAEQLDAAQIARVEHVVAHHDQAVDAAASQAIEHGSGVREAERARAGRVRGLVGLHQQRVGGALHHRHAGGLDAERVEEAPEAEEVLVGRVRRGEARDHAGALAVDESFEARRSGLDRDREAGELRHAERAAHERVLEAIGRADLAVGHAAGVADPGVVDRVVAARQVAVDLVVRDAEMDVAAVAAAGADARHVLQEPDADLEAEVPGGERAHRADVGHVHRVVVLERGAGKVSITERSPRFRTASSPVPVISRQKRTQRRHRMQRS